MHLLLGRFEPLRKESKDMCYVLAAHDTSRFVCQPCTGCHAEHVCLTKAIRKIADEQGAELLLGMTERPMYYFGHRQVKTKQKVVALPALLPQEVAGEAEIVRDQVSDSFFSF